MCRRLTDCLSLCLCVSRELVVRCSQCVVLCGLVATVICVAVMDCRDWWCIYIPIACLRVMDGFVCVWPQPAARLPTRYRSLHCDHWYADLRWQGDVIVGCLDVMRRSWRLCLGVRPFWPLWRREVVIWYAHAPLMRSRRHSRHMRFLVSHLLVCAAVDTCADLPWRPIHLADSHLTLGTCGGHTHSLLTHHLCVAVCSCLCVCWCVCGVPRVHLYATLGGPLYVDRLSTSVPHVERHAFARHP